MIRFEKKVLSNGLRVLIHEDRSTPMVAVNVLYNVGSRDEEEHKTGFAHLFEHLMFGGSVNVSDFDGPIQMAGGENNAFTNADMTNFYDIVPAQNIETALWLESDRMLELAFSQHSLNVQKKVVVEEFKETCLNVPYGDLWHHLSDLAYKKHPYRWPTIGLVPEHIKEAQLEDVKDFFYKFYGPQNAILVIAGNLGVKEGIDLAEKWFGSIQPRDVYNRRLPQEPKQESCRLKEVRAKVPMPCINLAFHMPDRMQEDYYVYDLLSDILGSGASSRFYQNLVKKNNIFSDLDAFITGSLDPGLFIITGKPMEGIEIAEARKHLWAELEALTEREINTRELQKIKNKAESNLVFSEISILHKAMSLAYFELLGDANMINQESGFYQEVSAVDIRRIARETFTYANCNELVYYPN